MADIERHKCKSCGNTQEIDIDKVVLDHSGEMELLCEECGQRMVSSLSVALKLFCVACGETYEEGSSCTSCGGLSMKTDFEISCSGCGSVEQIEQNLMKVNSIGLLLAKCSNCVQIRLVKGE